MAPEIVLHKDIGWIVNRQIAEGFQAKRLNQLSEQHVRRDHDKSLKRYILT